ncbi:MAG: 50S ribosomal protein L4 [Candidatus Micrarchaeota archaeon]
MKANVISLDGTAGVAIELPSQFNDAFRPDLIRRAFSAERSRLFQPKGAFPLAGMQNTARYYGRRHAWRQTINTGRSRLPREKLPKGRSGRVLQVPHAVKGRRAHPPKPQKILIERINIKEKNAAIRSAIAATADARLVKLRGHRFDGALPLVVEDGFEGIKRVKEAKAVLEKCGLSADLERAKEGRQMRSGRARLRKGGYRTPCSVLVVYAKDEGIGKAVRNLPGVEAARADLLTMEELAPGGEAGRLTLWTKGALAELGKGLYGAMA